MKVEKIGKSSQKVLSKLCEVPVPSSQLQANMSSTSKEEYFKRRNDRSEAKAKRHAERKRRREDSPERELQYYVGQYSLEVDAEGTPFSTHMEKFPQALSDGNPREALVRFYACYNVVIHFPDDPVAISIQKSMEDALMAKAVEDLGRTTRIDYMYKHYLYSLCGGGAKFQVSNARGNMYTRYDNERILSPEFQEFQEFHKYASKNLLPLTLPSPPVSPID
jgi:hypothetical protein